MTEPLSREEIEIARSNRTRRNVFGSHTWDDARWLATVDERDDVLRDLVEQEDGVYGWYDYDWVMCLYCRGQPPTETDGAEFVVHTPDCPVGRAEALLEESE